MEKEENLAEKENEAGIEDKSTKESWKELARFALAAVAITVFIRLFIAEPFIVSGSSMVPTFENGDYLIVDKISYELGNPKREDVVIFRYPGDPTKFFIKRVIGLPNEIVDIKGGLVTITNKEHLSGFTIREPYVKNPASNISHLELKDDEYFVMGDNRIASSDSRYWGAVNKKFLTGRAFLRLLPLQEINIWPGHYQQEN